MPNNNSLYRIGVEFKAKLEALSTKLEVALRTAQHLKSSRVCDEYVVDARRREANAANALAISSLTVYYTHRL